MTHSDPVTKPVTKPAAQPREPEVAESGVSVDAGRQQPASQCGFPVGGGVGYRPALRRVQGHA